MSMSQAYTPGLKRKALYIVRKTRRLPVFGEVLVNVGDKVSYNDIVAQTQIPGEPFLVNAAAQLGIENKEIETYMLKKVGEKVKKGEPFARYSAFFGLIKRVSVSPVDGYIENVSKISGKVLIRGDPIPVRINAYIPGTVVEVLPREGVVIETPATFIQGIFGVGGEKHGEIKVLAETPMDVLEAEDITDDCKGKVIIGGSRITGEALKKANELGVSGIVVGGIDDKDLIEFLGYEIGVAITGHEEINTTLIITEGFGKMDMSEKTFNLLKENEGKLACINGATQIRAGVMRPEVIIPLKNVPEDQLAKVRSGEEIFAGGLRPGTPIRIIRAPYFGALGKVVSLPVELRTLETESEVRVLEAELEDGRRVVVPRANVEIIEE